jgi:hypothetical protein
MAEKIDFLLPETALKIQGQLVQIAQNDIRTENFQGLIFPACNSRPSGAALIPVDHRVFLFERLLPETGQKRDRAPGAAVQDENHGIRAVISADIEKLVDAAYSLVEAFGNTVLRPDLRRGSIVLSYENDKEYQKHKRREQNKHYIFKHNAAFCEGIDFRSS